MGKSGGEAREAITGLAEEGRSEVMSETRASASRKFISKGRFGWVAVLA